MTTKPTTPTTQEKLDEMRARALANGYFPWQAYKPEALLVRQADEAAGIPTEGLLALMRGEAVIVPVEPAKEMADVFDKGAYTLAAYLAKHTDEIPSPWYAEWIAASPWAPKKDQDND